MFPFEAFSKKKVEVVKKVEEKESKTEKVVKRRQVNQIVRRLKRLLIVFRYIPNLLKKALHLVFQYQE